jgi:hypothetical protein
MLTLVVGAIVKEGGKRNGNEEERFAYDILIRSTEEANIITGILQNSTRRIRK